MSSIVENTSRMLMKMTIPMWHIWSIQISTLEKHLRCQIKLFVASKSISWNFIFMTIVINQARDKSVFFSSTPIILFFLLTKMKSFDVFLSFHSRLDRILWHSSECYLDTKRIHCGWRSWKRQCLKSTL